MQTRISQRRIVSIRLSVLVVAALLAPSIVAAQELSPAEVAARKASDPLGNVKALMTDNTIAFNAGESKDDTSFGFQLQPVYTIPNESPWNMIARAVVPIAGLEPGVVAPPIGSEPRPDTGSTWGLSDTVLQYFFSPKSESSWKWGVGPQLSLETRTSDRVAGPGWGGGVAGVLFGGSGQWSYGAMAMQHWGEDDFSIFTLQPIAIYLFKSLPGAYLGYNNSLTYDWNADSDNALTLPLGLTFGKALVFESGDFLDLAVGAYPLAVRPDNAPSWQLKIGVSYFFD